MDSDWTSPGYLAGLCLQYMLWVLEQYNYRFSLTFEVEGHCLVNRRVPCKIESWRPKPLKLPWEIFKMQVSQNCIFLQFGKEILLWRILILIIVKKNDTLGEFFLFHYTAIAKSKHYCCCQSLPFSHNNKLT